jgi:hypothetical protein
MHNFTSLNEIFVNVSLNNAYAKHVASSRKYSEINRIKTCMHAYTSYVINPGREYINCYSYNIGMGIYGSLFIH